MNKRLAEYLHNVTYRMELDGKPQSEIWALRRAAWAVDESKSSITEIYKNAGVGGILEINGVGKFAVTYIEGWLIL